MLLDLALACVHHLLIFALFGVLLIEFVLLKPGADASLVRRLWKIDASYGALAGLVLIVGFCRVFFGAKGWTYYEHTIFFWAKLGTFLLIALLSVPPTISLTRWRRAGVSPDDAAVLGVRRYLHYELGLFVLLPLFAAAMARGYGQL